MASGAFFSRVEIDPGPWALGAGGFPLIPGDVVTTYCGDGSRKGLIVRFETHTKHTAGSCLIECVPVAFVRDFETRKLSEAMPHLLKLAEGYEPPKPDFDADDLAGVVNYFRQRHQPILDADWEVFRYPYRALPLGDGTAWAASMHYRKWDPSVPKKDRHKPPYTVKFEDRYAIYVFNSYRGRGHLTNHVKRFETFKYITLDDCNVAGFYEKMGRDCLVIPTGGHNSAV